MTTESASTSEVTRAVTRYLGTLPYTRWKAEQASKEVCERLGALLQKNSGLLTTGFTEEKGGIGVWRLYLTCPESRVWKP